jgi:alpha-D-xyloside xylohydrolase
MEIDEGTIIARGRGETVVLSAARGSGVRVRATRNETLAGREWALADSSIAPDDIDISTDGARIRSGSTVAELSPTGVLRFVDGSTGDTILEEPTATKPYQTPARSYRAVGSDTWRVAVSFVPHRDERIYGMGQHQDGLLDKKGSVVDLLQRNTHVVIPFHYSTAGYAFIWNNPASGRAEFASNRTRWIADSCREIDYCVFSATSPATALRSYAEATGYPSPFPSFASGFWQSRLRYESQAEVLEVVREHRRRGLPLSVFVIDFFHWPHMGDWRFDECDWPDVEAMVREIRAEGAEVMVSVWPTVSPDSENYSEMRDRGYLVGAIDGNDAFHLFTDSDTDGSKALCYYDPFSEGAGRFVWERIKANYLEKGIRVFWLDSCEPEAFPYEPERFRYAAGRGDEVTNAYPLVHEQTFYQRMREAGVERPLNLCRSAWLGSQKYGAAVWSGDVEGSFEALRSQVPAGLSMAMSGIPWWTTDIGGFFVEDAQGDEYHELLIRWFQFGVFSPICRLHGYREPIDLKRAGPNELWSYGEDVYAYLRDLLHLRERLRPYVQEQMERASVTGEPVMRPLFFDFPNDPGSYEVDDQYMFGPDLLVAPVVERGARERRIYIPAGHAFMDPWTGTEYEAQQSGHAVTVAAPLERIPLLTRPGTDVVAAINPR